MFNDSINRPAYNQIGTNTPLAQTLRLIEEEGEMAGTTSVPVTTAPAVLPAVGSNVTLSVTDTTPYGVGQDVFLPGIGYVVVASVGPGLSITVTNIGLTGIAAPGTPIPTGTPVMPAGAIGANGAPGPPGMNTLLTDDFVNPPLGQTTFTLSMTPSAPGSVALYINGARQSPTRDFTVAGTIVTWTSGEFVIAPTDEVLLTYTV
jgi:hypothetical protein